jgi:hypothetical protein
VNAIYIELSTVCTYRTRTVRTDIRQSYVQYILSVRMYVQTVERRLQVLHTLGVETHLFYLFTFFFDRLCVGFQS